MHPKQAKWLARHPKAMIDYQARRKLPRMFRPASPLIDLLESITPKDRQRILGVKLTPALGYSTHQTFRNAEALLRWLKPAPEMIEGEPFPAGGCQMHFRKRLREDDLKPHCAQWFE